METKNRQMRNELKKTWTVLRASALLLLMVTALACEQPAAPPEAVPEAMPEAMPGEMPEGAPGGRMKMPSTADTEYTAAIYIRDGKYNSAGSTPSAVSGGTPGDSTATGLTIRSETDDLNGVFVRGESEYTLADTTITIDADGSNDFLGLGAGAMAEGGAHLTLKNVNITTTGVTACATVASNKAVIKVYNSTLITNGGTLPEDYVPFIGPGMKEPPAPLGITGNARTHVTMDNSESYFYDSTLISEGWGALSTDSAEGYVYLEANNCDVKVRKSGYATYADNFCNVVINDSRLDTPTYTGIMGGQSKIILNRTEAVSGGEGFLIHNVNSGADVVPILGINGGRLASKQAAILIKSANADIDLDSAQLVSESGVLIQSKLNDDANAIEVSSEVPGIHATLKNMALEGDIRHEDSERGMTLVFLGTRLQGAIENASVAIDADSQWTATSDSNITLSGAIDINCIDAPDGVTITATAGKGCDLSGAYTLASGGRLIVSAN